MEAGFSYLQTKNMNNQDEGQYYDWEMSKNILLHALKGALL